MTSPISNFKARNQKKAQQKSQLPETTTKAAMPKVKENTALTLLAKLLGVTEENAITKAEWHINEYAKSEKYPLEVGFDLAKGEDQSVSADVTIEDGKVTNVENIKDVIKESTADIANQVADQVSSSTDAVQDAASNVENAVSNVETATSDLESTAEKVNDSADNLAYTADDINTATDGIKEATAELKKPLVEPKSSNLKKTDKPQSNLTK